MKKLLFTSILIAGNMLALSQDWKTYPYTPEGSKLSFPGDEGRHPAESIEWWYTSGHLIGETTGNNYSFMLTYFFNPIYGFDGFRIFDFCDDDIGLFFDDTKPLYYNTLGTDSLNIEADIFTGGIESWRNKTDITGRALPFEYELFAESGFGSINLEYDAIKPPLILADSGFLYQGYDDYTYYYSQTENIVTGTIEFNGITENVTGTSWIDRQYGIFDPSTGLEYEWFCVQLSNGMDLNIFNIFTEDSKIPESIRFKILAVFVDETTQYTTSEFDIERLEYSFTDDELRCYAQAWRLTSPISDIDIIITALHHDNEVQLPFRFYEGATNIVGSVNNTDVTGKGFAELLHSYDYPDIIIDETTDLDTISTLLSWELTNPDDGNPITYDLEYSIDDQQSFSFIDQSVRDTFYFWDTRFLSEEEIWLKVTGYSIDNTIGKSFIKKLISNATSISSLNENELFRIFPNPSHGHFTITGENLKEIEIMSFEGETIYKSINIQPIHSIDLSSYPKGMYLIKVTTDNLSSTSKLILK